MLTPLCSGSWTHCAEQPGASQSLPSAVRSVLVFRALLSLFRGHLFAQFSLVCLLCSALPIRLLRRKAGTRVMRTHSSPSSPFSTAAVSLRSHSILLRLQIAIAPAMHFLITPAILIDSFSIVSRFRRPHGVWLSCRRPRASLPSPTVSHCHHCRASELQSLHSARFLMRTHAKRALLPISVAHWFALSACP